MHPDLWNLFFRGAEGLNFNTRSQIRACQQPIFRKL